jgi:hypothetical protein
VRPRFVWLEPLHRDQRALSAAVAHLRLVRSMRLLARAFLICSTAFVSCCARVEIPPSIEVWQDTADQFHYRGADFRRSIARALRDGDSGLREFIAGSRFVDGAGGYGFGIALLDIAQEVGDERFSRVAASLDQKEKEKVWLFLRAGAEYRHEPISDVELARRLPKTSEILTKT